MPVLVHSQLRNCVELLLQNRSNAKVKLQNPYLFGIPGNDKHRHKHLRACQLMREYSSKCGAEKPLTLRGTKLRKHIATKCITLNLSESEVTELANFMGHDKNIHKSHYRQSIPELDIPRFSRLLNVAIFNREENEDEDNDDVEGSNDEAVEENLISETFVNSTESSHPTLKINNNTSPKITQIKRRSSKYIFHNIHS